MSQAMDLTSASAAIAGRAVLHDIDLTVAPGELVGVLGPNGAGKTSLLRAALGLLPLTAGEARLAGHLVGRLNEPQRARLAAYLPQGRRAAWNLPAWRIAALGAITAPPAIAAERAHAVLSRVGLSALADRGVLDLSGGEQARVLLARLLASEAPLLLADEPAAGLDPEAQLMVMALFQAEAAAGKAVAVTLHDLTLAARWCDRVVVVHAGRIVSEGPPRAALGPQVLADVFGLDGEIIDTRAGATVVADRRTQP
jgi:iron complex transport system ATP-binding protein